MFDIGFWEIVLISIIGLVVLGPERLPVAIRTVKSWISSARQFSNNVKTELKEELRIHELHNDLKKAEQQNMSHLSAEVSDSVRSLKEAAAMVTRPYQNSTSVNSDLIAEAHTATSAEVSAETSTEENTVAIEPANTENQINTTTSTQKPTE